MQTNISKRLEKIIVEFGKINRFARGIIKYGFHVFIGLFALGTLLIVVNKIFLGFDSHLHITAVSLIKNSFTVLAEAVIGGLLIDHVLKKF